MPQGVEVQILSRALGEGTRLLLIYLTKIMEQQNNNSIPTTSQSNRPTIIMIVCVLGFFAALVVFVGLLMPSVRGVLTQQYGATFLPITLVSTLLGFMGLIGYWKMRKWGVYFYTLAAIINIVHGLILGIPGRPAYIGPIVIAAIGLIYLKRMR